VYTNPATTSTIIISMNVNPVRFLTVPPEPRIGLLHHKQESCRSSVRGYPQLFQ